MLFRSNFSGPSVTIDGATPGGDVVLFTVAKERTNSSPPMVVSTRNVVVLHADGKGSAIFSGESDVPPISVWIAIDLATGHSGASGAAGFRPLPLSDSGLATRDDAGRLRKFTAALPDVDLLLVRPGVGAWQIKAAKTSALDESARSERPLRIDVTRMIPVPGSPSVPESFMPGDVLAVVEPRTLRLAVSEVGQ